MRVLARFRTKSKGQKLVALRFPRRMENVFCKVM